MESGREILYSVLILGVTIGLIFLVNHQVAAYVNWAGQILIALGLMILGSTLAWYWNRCATKKPIE